MLDQADFVTRFDIHDTISTTLGQTRQLIRPLVQPKALGRIGRFSHIVCSAMGGSALPAEFVKDWLGDRLQLPIEVVRGYDLPAYVGRDSLVVCASYSGNTEETLAAAKQALARKAAVVVAAGGGGLLELAHSADLPAYELPKGLVSGQAVWAGIRMWVQLIEALGMTDGAVREIEQAAAWLTKQSKSWSVEVTTDSNDAKRIASELLGHPVVIYAGPALRYAALRWKVSMNEFGKNIAFANVFPEVNHNEMSGWKLPRRHGLKVVELYSDLDVDRIRQRMDITNRLVSNVFAPLTVEAEGSTKVQQLLWSSMLGEMSGVYLGILNQEDPLRLDVVDKLKSELGKR